MKLFGISENFIEIYDNALPKTECEILISHFEKSQQKVPGRSGIGNNFVVDPSTKKGIELPNCQFSKQDIISTLIKPALFSCLDRYKTAHPSLGYLYTWRYEDTYTFKKFESEDDGFKRWHCEAGGLLTCPRILAWMFYLNDAKSGTEFKDHPTVRAKIGRCIIWPAAWTHTHRSQIPNKGLKYIISGWVSYNAS